MISHIGSVRTTCLAGILAASVAACSTEGPVSPSANGAGVPTRSSGALAVPVDEPATPATIIGALGRGEPGGPRDRPESWVDGERFSGVVTPATFDPANGNFDELYAGCPGGFKYGVPLISESKPGDQDYNGGRWHLNLITNVADCADYADADRVESLSLSEFTSTDMYFECPLLPRRGRGRP